MIATHKRIFAYSPFIKLLLPFIFGIACYEYLFHYEVFKIICFAIGCTALLMQITWFSVSANLKFKLRSFKSLSIPIFYFVLAVLVAFCQEVIYKPNWYKHIIKSDSQVIVRVLDYPIEKEKTFKLHVDIEQTVGKVVNVARGESFLYLAKNTLAAKLQVGDYLLVNNKFHKISENHNPGAFNYSKYAHRINIYEQAFLQSDDWKSLHKNKQDFYTTCKRFNASIRKILSTYIDNDKTLALCEALLIGYRNHMDEETTQSFANAGIVHIIAISGMHIMMIYYSLLYLFSLIPFFKKRKRLQYVVVLAIIWMFTCITGLPASITRAACMVTCITLGTLMNKRMSSFNNIAVSAFILLCIKPMWLFDIGFQLSYAAVLGIMICYKPLANFFYMKNYLANKVSQLCALNIAAQVFTLPLCLFYFHQFPVLFLLTNLIAIPLSTLLLYLTILLLLLSPISFLSKGLVYIIERLSTLFTEIILHLSNLQFALVDRIYFDFLMMILLFAFIISLLIWLTHRFSIAFFLTSFCLLFLLLTMNFHQFASIHQSKLIIFENSQEGGMSIIHGKKAHFNFPFGLKNINKTTQYLIKPLLTHFHIKHADLIDSTEQQVLSSYQLSHEKVVYLHQSNANPITKIKCDKLICSKGVKPDSIWFQQNMETHHIILDASVPKWKEKQWQTLCKQLHCALHIVNVSGAFVYNY